jgi:hypothetical protein
MAQGQRPGGLTALAVLNFIAAFSGVLTAIGHGILLQVPERRMNHGQMETFMRNPAIIAGSLVLTLCGVGLLITSAVGYLGQRRFLGRILGSLCAVVSLAQTGYSLALMGEPFSLGVVVHLVYPTLSAVLLNTVFREDFIRP